MAIREHPEQMNLRWVEIGWLFHISFVVLLSLFGSLLGRCMHRLYFFNFSFPVGKFSPVFNVSLLKSCRVGVVLSVDNLLVMIEYTLKCFIRNLPHKVTFFLSVALGSFVECVVFFSEMDYFRGIGCESMI